MIGNVTFQENNSKRRGPPLGSQNAKGHGAPKGKNALGNREGPVECQEINAVTTGENETIFSQKKNRHFVIRLILMHLFRRKMK